MSHHSCSELSSTLHCSKNDIAQCFVFKKGPKFTDSFSIFHWWNENVFVQSFTLVARTEVEVCPGRDRSSLQQLPPFCPHRPNHASPSQPWMTNYICSIMRMSDDPERWWWILLNGFCIYATKRSFLCCLDMLSQFAQVGDYSGNAQNFKTQWGYGGHWQIFLLCSFSFVMEQFQVHISWVGNQPRGGHIRYRKQQPPTDQHRRANSWIGWIFWLPQYARQQQGAASPSQYL